MDAETRTGKNCSNPHQGGIVESRSVAGFQLNSHQGKAMMIIRVVPALVGMAWITKRQKAKGTKAQRRKGAKAQRQKAKGKRQKAKGKRHKGKKAKRQKGKKAKRQKGKKAKRQKGKKAKRQKNFERCKVVHYAELWRADSPLTIHH
jgi:hypothetical protein